MSDDAAFIAAIQGSPCDELPRQVYADWLEERGQPDNAEYLRLVHALTALPEEAVERRKLVERLIAVAGRIDEEWRNAAGRRFDVVLEGWLGGALQVFLRAVQWLSGFTAANADKPNERTHSLTLQSAVRREEAEAFLDRADSRRFRKGRTAKQIYRIVPSEAASAIPTLS